MKIELGGGANPKKGYANIDIREIPEVDYVCNFENERLPFENESIEEIYSAHTFEHVESTIHLMNECWRTLKWNGILKVIVPHKDCILAWQDPTHKTYWTEENMKFFCGKYLKKYKLNYGIKCCFELIKNEITIPDNRPEYFKQIEFLLKKNKQYYTNVGYPKLGEKILKRTSTEKKVLDVLEQRWDKGRKVYGEGISFKQLDSKEKWLSEAIEEIADALQYLVAMKEKMEYDERNK